jgi:hypothetical protein
MPKSSARRVASSRANGAQSKGPVTPDGKSRSSQNARLHGFCAEIMVLSTEDRPQYDQLYQAHILRFQPVDDIELHLVEKMVNAMWRERRAWYIETEALESKLVSQSKWIDNWNEKSPAAQTAIAFASVFPESPIDRYETRMSRLYDRARKSLLELRKSQPIPVLPKEPSPTIEHPPAQSPAPDLPATVPPARTTDHDSLTPASAITPTCEPSRSPSHQCRAFEHKRNAHRFTINRPYKSINTLAAKW